MIWTPNSNGQVKVHKQLPTASDVHYDAYMTDFGIAYMQDQSAFMASSVFTPKPVSHQTDKYPVWPKADFFRDEARKRTPGTEVQRGGYRLSSDSYYCDVYEHGTKIPDEVRGNADSWANLDKTATEYLTGILMIRREVDFCSTFLTTSVWGTDITGVSSGENNTSTVRQWNDSAATPITDVLLAHRTIKLATGRSANTMIVGFDVWRQLLVCPQIVNRLINGQMPGQIAQVTNQDLANIFKVQRFVVAEAVYNTAKEGATASMSFVAGKVAWLGYVDPSPSIQSLTAGATFVWTGAPGGSSGLAIERQYDPKLRSDLVDGFANWSMKVTASDAAVFFTTIVA